MQLNDLDGILVETQQWHGIMPSYSKFVVSDNTLLNILELAVFVPRRPIESVVLKPIV